MRRRNSSIIAHRRAAFTLALLISAPGTSEIQLRARTPVVTTPLFAFYSDFATNLNDALLAAATDRRFDRAELFHAGAEASCFDALAPSARAGWDRAVDYYAEIISPTDWDGRQQQLLRAHLYGDGAPAADSGAARFVAIAEGFWAAAGPAYEACRWPAQDAANRRWIEKITVVLAVHEPVITPRLEALYQTSWQGLPILVDIVETVSWSGANSISRQPSGGHLLISVSYEGPAALEIVFHEASHLLVGRDSPLRAALTGAADTLGLDPGLPGDLWHPLMFYTTGETVRDALAGAGEPGYTPMIFEIFGRSRWGRYQKAIEDTWPGYLNGQRTLTEAAADLLRATGPSEPQQP